jgi:AcrR family transcriptional regulator
MGRPREFSREEVLEKAIPVFWKRGFADTSVQDLEKATGVNKSGLYSEFKGKEDLFLASLEHYIAQSTFQSLLAREPLGWNNVAAMLSLGITCSGQKGCFVVNSVREASLLPPQAHELMAKHLGVVKKLLVRNLEAAGCRGDPNATAELILTFNTGLCLEQNFGGSAASYQRKVQEFLKLVKNLSSNG